MKCLESLSLANNGLTGSVPTCLSNISVDISGNDFGSTVAGVETPEN